MKDYLKLLFELHKVNQSIPMSTKISLLIDSGLLEIYDGNELRITDAGKNQVDLFIESEIVAAINKAAQLIHDNAILHGWYKEDHSLSTDDIVVKLALIHSEVSEAVECVRDGDNSLHYGGNGKPLGLASEIADIAIRSMDLLAAIGVDSGGIIAEKHNYNITRAYRHGGKLC